MSYSIWTSSAMEPNTVNVMISQPMSAYTHEEIMAVREKATHDLEELGYTVINNYTKDGWDVPEDARNTHLFYMSQDIEVMSKCNAVYFVKGWEKARGCRAEHYLAEAYGIDIIYEEEPSNG